MRLGTKRHLWMALAVVVTLSLTAAGYTHGRGRPWWLRPPAAEIQDVTFTGGATERGSVKSIVVTDGQFVSYARTDLDDASFDATLVAGVLTINEIVLTSADGATTATVALDPATLRRNFLNSTFSADGTATVDVTTTVIDPVTSEESAVVATTIIPVAVFGLISEKDGVYKLRAHIRGLTSVDDGAGTVTYTLFKLELEAEAPVPTTS